MSSYTPPTYTDLTIFNPLYWENTTSTEYLTYSQAISLFVSLNGNQTISGMMDFTGGISTNYISPIAINDNLVLDDYSNIYLTTNTSNVCIYSSGNILNVANPINATEYYINGNSIFPTIDSNVSGYVLSNDGTSTEWIQQNSSLTIGGSNTQIQFNNNGNLDASANLTWNGSNLDIIGNINASQYYINNNLLIPTIDSNVSGYVLSNDGTSTEWIENTTIPSISSLTSNQYLYNDGNAISWANVSTGLTIGGSTNQIQFNSSGNLAGSSSMTFVDNTFTAFSLTANASTIALINGANLNFIFANGWNCPQSVSAGSIASGVTTTRYFYDSGFVVISCYYDNNANWNYAYGMFWGSTSPKFSVAGTNPSINYGYSNGAYYISFTNSSTTTLYYNIWVFGDGVST
jgi:hypothetical protein